MKKNQKKCLTLSNVNAIIQLLKMREAATSPGSKNLINQINQITMKNSNTIAKPYKLLSQIFWFISPDRVSGYKWFLENRPLEDVSFKVLNDDFYLVLNNYSTYLLKDLPFKSLLEIAAPFKARIELEEKTLYKTQEQTWFEKGWGAL